MLPTSQLVIRQAGVRTKTNLPPQAAQWGANQELEACCEWLERNDSYPQDHLQLRAARRPEPPSLKEQALEAL
jgi:hypothetical protein